MRLISLFLTAILGFSNSAAVAQSAGTSVQSSSVLQQSLAVLVGNAALSDVTLSGSVRRIAGSDDESGTVVYKALSNGAMRFDFAYPSGAREDPRRNQCGSLGNMVGSRWCLTCTGVAQSGKSI